MDKQWLNSLEFTQICRDSRLGPIEAVDVSLNVTKLSNEVIVPYHSVRFIYVALSILDGVQVVDN